MKNELEISKNSVVGISMPMAIEQLNGTRLIGSAKDVFKLFISSTFLNSFFSEKSKFTTRPHYFSAYRVHDPEFVLANIFSIWHKSWDERVVTQNQIVEFCAIYGDYLKNSFSFFLCKKDEYSLIDQNDLSANLFVVLVQGHIVREKSELAVYSLEFDDKHVWKDRAYYQFIVPESKFLKGT